jgi:hypothetical protein
MCEHGCIHALLLWQVAAPHNVQGIDLGTHAKQYRHIAIAIAYVMKSSFISLQA